MEDTSSTSNVLLDVITQDKVWSSWSEAALRKAAEHSTLAINPIIFAEVSMKFARIEDADAALVDFEREPPLPFEAGFLYGKGLPCVQEARRGQTFADAGFLRGCPRGHRSHGSAHSRRGPIRNLLSRVEDHRTVGDRTGP